MNDLQTELFIVNKKANDTGIVTLSPKKMRIQIRDFLLTMGAIQRKIVAEEDASAMVKKGKDQLRQISVDIRKIVGTYGLGE